MKLRQLCAVLLCAALFLATPALALENPYVDLSEEEWFAEAALEMTELGAMTGVSGNEFGTYEPVTRATAVTVLWRLFGAPEANTEESFPDVEDTWYVTAAAWAKATGLAGGYEDGSFQPDELVTVAAVRDILDNFAQVFGTNAVAVADLTTLTGEEDEAVLNCDEILAEFFGEEYILAEVEDEIAA